MIVPRTTLASLLLLLGASTQVDARLKATSNRHEISGAIFVSPDQLDLGGSSGASNGCITYKLSFPESCCPSTYTRVKSTRSHSAQRNEPRQPGKEASKRRDRVKRAKKMLEHRATSGDAQRRRDAWMEAEVVAEDDGYLREGEQDEPSQPQWSNAKAVFHQSIPKRLRNQLTPPPPKDHNAPSHPHDDCPVALVHSQSVCPSPEDRHLVESNQIERLETFKDLGGGKQVLVECGSLGLFWY